MNARERMLARKAERADEAREARMQELRESGAEQASVRAQAKDQERRLYTSTFDNVRKQEKESSDTTVEAKSSVKDPLNDPLGMNADELLAKLSEADNGGKRYEIQSQDILNPHSRQSSGSPLANNNNNNGGVGGGYLEDDSVHVDSDDLLGSDSDDVSEFGSEDEGWARPEVREDGIDDAEEDIKAHEEELKAELEAATLRCQSLRRTLVQTKSMLRMKEKENSPMRSPGLLQPDEVIVEDAVEVDDDDIDDDDIEDDDESNGIDEEEEEEEELRANSSLIREATGMGPQLKQLNIPPPSYPVTPKRKPSAEPRPSPELSDMPSPKGRLADRISVLRQRCVEGLGQSKFDAAHSYLKQIQDAQDIGYEMGGENMVEEEEDEATQQRRLTSILGHDMVHYSSLIEQLIFMEDTLLD